MKKLLIIFLAAFSFSAFATKTVELMDFNTVPIYGKIPYRDNNMLLSLKAAALARGEKTYPIYIVINSGGGSVQDGALFIKEAAKHKNLSIVVVKAGSMAANIVQLIPGAKRYHVKNAKFLYHPFRHNLNGITTIDLLNYVQRIFHYEKSMNQAIMERLGISALEFYMKVHTDEILKGKQIKEFNLSDEVVEIKCSDRAKVTKVLITTELGISTTSLCPLKQ